MRSRKNIGEQLQGDLISNGRVTDPVEMQNYIGMATVGILLDIRDQLEGIDRRLAAKAIKK